MKLHVLPLTLLLGCATVPPPKELVAARSSFERAEKGIAAKLAPAALDSAKQALQKAERAFRDTSDSPETRALGYIADRRARQAETEGELQEAEGNKVAAQKEFAERSAEELDRARTAIKSERPTARGPRPSGAERKPSASPPRPSRA
jgi:Tfp pilus assembly protein PilX